MCQGIPKGFDRQCLVASDHYKPSETAELLDTSAIALFHISQMIRYAESNSRETSQGNLGK
jgi:hypothetical protein